MNIWIPPKIGDLVEVRMIHKRPSNLAVITHISPSLVRFIWLDGIADRCSIRRVKVLK